VDEDVLATGAAVSQDKKIVTIARLVFSEKSLFAQIK